MHRETLTTFVLGILALVLTVAVWALAPSPDLPEDDFNDEGQPFFAELTSAETIRGLEVRVLNVSANRVENFRVEEAAGGAWVIPSHHNYPADAQEELGKVVRSFMGLKRDRMVALAIGEHEQYGVIDPDDRSTTQIGGRGRKIIFRDQAGKIVAQFIVGNEVPAHNNRPKAPNIWEQRATEDAHREFYIRIPDEKRVYAVKFQPHLSTEFGNWINPQLLPIQSDQIQKFQVNSYSINEDKWPQIQRVPHDSYSLSRMIDATHPAPGTLVLDGLTSKEEMNATRLDELTDTLCNLKIVGVRSIQEYFQTEGRYDQQNQPLRGAGYFLDSQNKLHSNEGEVAITTADGLQLILCFGELTGGVGEALTAGVSAKEEAALHAQPGEKKWDNRYLWIQVGYTGSKPAEGQPEPPGLQKARELSARFNQYFYVISDEKVAKLRQKRADLVQAKVETPTGATPPGTTPANPPPANGANEIVPATPPGQPSAQPVQPPAPSPAPAPTSSTPAVPPPETPIPAAPPPQ